MSISTQTARDRCEAWLHEEVRTNTAQAIAPSEGRVAERMLDRGSELSGVYNEIQNALRRDHTSWKIFLGAALSTAAYWSPDRLARYRAEREKLAELNRDVAKQARALAALLAERAELSNRSAFSSNTHYDICLVIDEACARNGRYQSYVKAPLESLNARFDTKYWPTLADCVEVLAADAERAKVRATDPLTEAATRSSRPSKADFIRALWESIDENRGDWVGAYPAGFNLSDGGMAALVNVLLDLPPQEMVDATYVKNLRHRDKECR